MNIVEFALTLTLISAQRVQRQSHGVGMVNGGWGKLGLTEIILILIIISIMYIFKMIANGRFIKGIEEELEELIKFIQEIATKE